jgi:hypothetical protein
MSEKRKVVGWLGVCGFLITPALYVCWSLRDYTRPPTTFDVTLGLVSFILCPPSMLSILCIDCEVGTASGLPMYLLIALLNAGLYSAIGFLVLKLRRADELTQRQ